MAEVQISADHDDLPPLVCMDSDTEDEDENSVAAPLFILPLISFALQPSLPSEQDDSLELSPTTNTTTDFVSSLLVLDNYIKISYKPLPIISVPFTSETLNETFVAHQNSEVQSSTYDI